MLVLDRKQGDEIQIPLKNLGYKVVGHVENIQETLEKVVELQPDLVLIGIHLDGKPGGIALGQQIYNQFDLPVIYVSDQSSQTTIRRSGGTAPFGYLFKLNDERHIMAIIEVALSRHGMEIRLRESEQWMNTIVSCISEGLITLDMENRISFLNPIAEILIGRKSSEVLRQHVREILQLNFMNSEEPVPTSRLTAFSDHMGLRSGIEAALHNFDGAKIPVEIFTSPLIKNGLQVGTVLAIRDISERLHATEEIRKYAIRSQAMLKVTEKLNMQLDVKAVLRAVCEICVEALNVNAAASFLISPTKKTLISHSLVIREDVRDYAREDRSFEGQYEIPVELIAQFLSKAQPVLSIHDIQEIDIPNLPYIEKIKELDVSSLVISGIYQQDEELIGALVAQSYRIPREFSSEDLDLIRGLTDQATIALGNSVLFEQVVASRERQQALTRRLVNLQEEERKNLARELHDQIGQMLTGLQFSLRALLAKALDEQKKPIIDMQELVSEVIAQTREISINLRPSMLDDMGLLQTLLWHFDRYTAQTHIRVNFQQYNIEDKPFKTEIETAIFRIIQEALTNVARYAETDSVEVKLKLIEKKIQMEIRDQGRGFEPEHVDSSTHLGLTSMRERAFTIGGMLDIQSAPGKGTRIYATIPLSGKVERRQHER